MKYKIVKSKCNIHVAAKELANGCFMRRTWWEPGRILFTKEDYKITEWGNEFRGRDYNSMQNGKKITPQFWFQIGGSGKYIPQPDDILTADWEVVQAISLTEFEKSKVKGKYGGISFYREL